MSPSKKVWKVLTPPRSTCTCSLVFHSLVSSHYQLTWVKLTRSIVFLVSNTPLSLSAIVSTPIDIPLHPTSPPHPHVIEWNNPVPEITSPTSPKPILERLLSWEKIAKGTINESHYALCTHAPAPSIRRVWPTRFQLDMQWWMLLSWANI